MDTENTPNTDTVSPNTSLLGGNEATTSTPDSNTATETSTNTEVTVATANTETQTYGMDDLLKSLGDDYADNKTLGKYKSVEELAKGTVELAKMVGYKTDVPNPDTATPDEWNEFYSKIGKPEDVAGYGLEVPEALKAIQGGEEKVNKAMALAHEANLTKAQADVMFKGLFDLETDALVQHSQAQERLHTQNLERLTNEWGNGFDAMAGEVMSLQKKLGIFDDFEANGLNGNPDVLMAFGKIAKQLGESSTIDSAIATTPVGVEQEIQEVNSQVREYLSKNQKVPAHLQTRLDELFKLQ